MTADAHEQQPPTPEEPASVDLDLVPEQTEGRTEEEDGHDQPGLSEHELESLQDVVAHGTQRLGVGEQTEESRHDQEDDPHVALVTLPDRGLL